MANYLSPGNVGFQKIRNAEYVDKSGLTELVNRTIRTPQKSSCVSRPRWFGKSFAAKMLFAYYDRSYDSRALFDDLAIAQNPTYEAAVAEEIERVHAERPSLYYYNTGQELRSTIQLAYFSYADHYLWFEELLAGAGTADIVYLPKRYSPYPPLVVELKWDASAKGAEPGHRTHSCKIEVA